MRSVTVDVSRKYNVLIGSGLLSGIGEAARSLTKAETVCIVSDTNVMPLYGKSVEDSLLTSGFTVISWVFSAGEESKNTENYLKLLNFLAENRVTRSDLVIALGGGVVGDLAGFAAATYLRGIPYIQIPTTLLSAVDSSVGGKTAIDLPGGKNLCGAFYQPILVICDTDTLNTLPRDIFRDGCAEVIKYGVLYDPPLFDMLEASGPDFNRETVIAKCVEWKANVVKQDERDTGERMKLNLGHTIGHGVEACSNFTLSHGKSVAIGMAIVCRASKCEDSKRILACLDKFGLPTTTEYSAEEILVYTLADKKRSGGTVKLIIPQKIGECSMVPTPVDDMLPFIQAGL